MPRRPPPGALARWFPRRWLVPVAAAAALGVAATPAAADQVRHREWWLKAIHVTTAWQSSRGAGVTVAVLDSGVDPAHRDLAGSVQTGPDFTRTGEAPGSAHWGGHGTAMAALIAGHGHGPRGADGMAGIAPDARILSLRVVPDRGDPALGDPAAAGRLPDAIASGITYAVAHGARVIDLPLDPGAADAAGRAGARAARGGSAAESNAVRYALGKGAVLVAPAGDDREHGGGLNYPAAYPGVVAAGAIDQNFDPAPFTSGGSYVSLTGPGVEVTTARRGNSYTTVSSTSAATAVVAGVAALIRAEYPGLTPGQVAQALTQGTLYRHARRAGSGYGAVDATGALHAAAAISAAAATQPASQAASPSAGTAPAQPAGFLGNVLRVLVAVAVVVVLAAAAFLLGRALRRRRAGRPRPDPGSPPSGGLSGPAPGSGERRASPIAALPRPHRRPRLSPVTGLPPPGAAKPSGRPPWEDAPKPTSPPPVPRTTRPRPGWEQPRPSPDTAPQQRIPPGRPPADDAPGDGTPAADPGTPDTSGTVTRPNGLSGYGQPGTGHQQGAGQADPDAARYGDTVPRPGADRSGQPGWADPGLYEEDPQPFDDEDDRHL